MFALVSIRFEVRGGFRPVKVTKLVSSTNVSIRFEVRGGFRQPACMAGPHGDRVSIRFEVRGGFRPGTTECKGCCPNPFQSALRFAVVSDKALNPHDRHALTFQSALRFAVVSDDAWFNLSVGGRGPFQSALRFAVVSDPTP